MPFRLGPTELVIILVAILIIFGAGKLPQVGANLGKAIKEFRQARAGEDEEHHRADSRAADGVESRS